MALSYKRSHIRVLQAGKLVLQVVRASPTSLRTHQPNWSFKSQLVSVTFRLFIASPPRGDAYVDDDQGICRHSPVGPQQPQKNVSLNPLDGSSRALVSSLALLLTLSPSDTKLGTINSPLNLSQSALLMYLFISPSSFPSTIPPMVMPKTIRLWSLVVAFSTTLQPSTMPIDFYLHKVTSISALGLAISSSSSFLPPSTRTNATSPLPYSFPMMLMFLEHLVCGAATGVWFPALFCLHPRSTQNASLFLAFAIFLFMLQLPTPATHVLLFTVGHNLAEVSASETSGYYRVVLYGYHSERDQLISYFGRDFHHTINHLSVPWFGLGFSPHPSEPPERTRNSKPLLCLPVSNLDDHRYRIDSAFIVDLNRQGSANLVVLVGKSLQAFRVALFGGSLQPTQGLCCLASLYQLTTPQGKSPRQFTPLASEEHLTLEFLRPEPMEAEEGNIVNAMLTNVNSLNLVTTDVGRCRAWLRLALNDCLLSSYLGAMRRENSALKPYYRRSAFVCDSELLDVVQRLALKQKQKILVPASNSILSYSPASSFGPILACSEDEALKIILGTPVDEAPIARNCRLNDNTYSDESECNNKITSECTQVKNIPLQQDDRNKATTSVDDGSSSFGNSLIGRVGWSSSFQELPNKQEIYCDASDQIGQIAPHSHMSLIAVPSQNRVTLLRSPSEPQSYHSLLESYNLVSGGFVKTPDLRDFLHRFDNASESSLDMISGSEAEAEDPGCLPCQIIQWSELDISEIYDLLYSGNTNGLELALLHFSNSLECSTIPRPQAVAARTWVGSSTSLYRHHAFLNSGPAVCGARGKVTWSGFLASSRAGPQFNSNHSLTFIFQPIHGLGFEVVPISPTSLFDIPEFGSMVQQLGTLATEPGLDVQNYTCKGCGHPIGINFAKAR
uniref:RUN domain-containing protein n=1 Tax=Timema bartmani TaxID=61472 RepID=A0A7R9F690_9NEOP|nr:unnamed protein product [Timema bartmani]